MRPTSRALRLCLAGLLAFAAVIALSQAIAGSDVGPEIEAVNKPGGGFYGEETHAWAPPAATVGAGGTVTLSNNTPIEHGVHWISDPEAPVCSGIPVGTTSATKGANWSGTCTFTKPGTYTFYCTVHGPEMTGTITVPGTPSATTESPTGVTQRHATLNGLVKSEGNVVEYHFEYGTTAVSEHTTSVLNAPADFGNHVVAASLTDLSPGVTYHAQLVAVYGSGKTTLLGGEHTFTTLATTVPSVVTGLVTGLGETEATLNGTVDPEGEATEYFFEYGTSLADANGQPTEPGMILAESGADPVSATVTGLAPGREYHYRLIASNPSGGPEQGADRTFTTTSTTPSTPSSTASASPSSPTAVAALSALAPNPPRGPSAGGGSPFAGGSHALELAGGQHGPLVRGSLEVAPAGAGDRLEVAVFTTAASLAAVRHSSPVRIGRLRRASVRAGIVSFAVPLSARGRSALHRHHRLVLTVRIVLTPISGAPAATVARSVVLHG